MNKFYKTLAAFVVCAVCALSGWAYDFEEGGLYYNISGNNVSLTTGDNAYSGEIVIPATVEHDGVTYNVTSIAGEPFRGNTAITSLSIPGSVTTLPDYAMANCTSLTTLILGDGVTWLGALMTNGCSSLTTIKIYCTNPPGYNHTGTIATYAHQCKPFPNGIQTQATFYVPEGCVDAYKAKAAQGANNAITTKLYDRVTNWVEIAGEDEIEVESVSISPENPVLAAEEGATVQLTTSILPENATYQTIWLVYTVATTNLTLLISRPLLWEEFPLLSL